MLPWRTHLSWFLFPCFFQKHLGRCVLESMYLLSEFPFSFYSYIVLQFLIVTMRTLYVGVLFQDQRKIILFLVKDPTMLLLENIH